MINLDNLKAMFLNSYNVKNLKEEKTIIRWQITKDPMVQIIKID